MKLQSRCRYCGDSCEWTKGEDGSLTPTWPCARSPSGACEPGDAGSVMVRQIYEGMRTRASYGRKKQR